MPTCCLNCREVAGAPGVVAHAVIDDDHVNEPRDLEGGIAGDPREVAPDAMLADGVARMKVSGGGDKGDVGVDGELVSKDTAAAVVNAMSVRSCCSRMGRLGVAAAL